MSGLIFLQAEPVHKAAEEFGRLDPYGLGMTVIAMSVVFFALIFLYLFFKNLGKLFTSEIKRPRLRVFKSGITEHIPEEEDETSGDEIAAIAMALHLYRAQLQDMEDTVLTIKRVTRNYSPWSSKIYGIRQTPIKYH